MKQLDSARLSDVQITDTFWSKYISLIARVSLPYQWRVLNGEVGGGASSACIKNYKIAAGEEVGRHSGVVFIDSDLTKWIEAVAYILESTSAPELEEKADYAIDLISKAQQDDGYINTYFTTEAPEDRWKNLAEGHELYCAGYLIEAAVAYYHATGKDKLLKAAIRLADLLCDVFGVSEGQIKGYPGHQEIELALVKLYNLTDKRKYLDLSMFFINERGKEPNYFIQEKRKGTFSIFDELKDYDPIYSQSHIQPRLQTTAEGHAVRALYMYIAMADLACAYDDKSLMNACDRIWENIVTKRMYITGSVGASSFWERFTADYDLPNDINYSESCASVGLMLLGDRLSRIKHDSSYYDIVELALYNTVLSAISLDGKSYFYVNPLEVWPASCMAHTSKMHVKPVRQEWFDVACCPTNVARTLASLGRFIYSGGEKSIYLNLFISNKATFNINGACVSLALDASLLSDGRSSLEISASEPVKFDLNIRVPEYVKSYSIKADGKKPEHNDIKNGYLIISKQWSGVSEVDIEFIIEAQFIASNPRVRANAGKVAIKRGPVVYCLEEKDNGSNLQSVYINSCEEPRYEFEDKLFDGTGVIKLIGKKISENEWNGKLYKPADFKIEDISLTAIPYHLWGNRGENEMLVWMKAML